VSCCRSELPGELTVTATPLKNTDNGFGGKSLCSEITLKNDSGDSQDYNALNFKIQTRAVT
jgi:hypothetical protein